MTMTTPIVTFEDILIAMKNDPNLREAMRQHILGQEFLQLPIMMRELKQVVAQLAQTIQDHMATTNTRLERLETGQAKLETGQATTNTRLERLETGQAKLETGQATTNTRLERLETGQATTNTRLERLETGQATTNTRLERLETGQATTNTRLERLETGQARLEGNMNRLIGSDYERKAARRASRLVQRHLGVNSMRVIYAITAPDDNQLSELLDQAINTGGITTDEADEIENTDLILNGPGLYIVAEVSVTLDDEDIRRAQKRARLLAQATTEPVKAAAIGAHALDTAIESAAEHDTTIIILPK